jgi:hypothetical protein
MGKGHEFLHRLNEALLTFEQAVVKREHKRMLDSAISLQQDVDEARQKVIQAAVEIAKEAREVYGDVKR